MSIASINRAIRVGLTILALTTFGTVLQAVVRGVISGQVPPPEADEGTAAHRFQLAAAGSVLAGLMFVATADWTQPQRAIRALLVPVAALAVAFAVLFYFEKIYYPMYYR